MVTLLLFFVFLALAFTLDKSFSSVEDEDVVEVHRQPHGRTSAASELEGRRSREKHGKTVLSPRWVLFCN